LREKCDWRAAASGPGWEPENGLLARRCHHQAELDADHCPDEVSFDDLQVRIVCSVCDHKGADVRPEWGSMGSRTLR